MLADPAGADDAALVEAVRRGDDRAFEELYGRYLPQITGFVAGRVHDHARAEDIAQDVFVSALRRIRATESAIAFRPWIYEIARNACIDAYRRGRRAEQVPLESERLAPPTATGSSPAARRPRRRSPSRRSWTTCAARSARSPTPTTRSSSSASSRGSATRRSASGWG